MNEFFTWEFLGTFAGATLATAILTQFFKGVFDRLPTQILSYILALVVMFCATAATLGFASDWTVWAMIPLNAVLVSLASNGAYDAVVRVTGK